jgi:hypothetical protein
LEVPHRKIDSLRQEAEKGPVKRKRPGELLSSEGQPGKGKVSTAPGDSVPR